MNEIIAKAAGEVSAESVKQANNFLSKLYGPALEERGLIKQDNIRFQRWKNEVEILQKAQMHLAKKGLSAKEISLKSLVPLLDYSSLESESSLQDLWARLLSNMIQDRDRDMSVFIHILKELSSADAKILHLIYEYSIQALPELSAYTERLAPTMEQTLIRKQFPDCDFNLDNLRRLNLIERAPNIRVVNKLVAVYLTTLGYLFFNACNT